MPSGIIFEGKWERGALVLGRGIYPDGKSYDGEWLDGKSHGFGTKTWPDGKKYEGYWKCGMPEGKGRKIHKDGTVKEGEFINGKF